MLSQLRLALLLSALVPAAFAACGGNVILDSQPGSAGGAGGTTTNGVAGSTTSLMATSGGGFGVSDVGTGGFGTTVTAGPGGFGGNGTTVTAGPGGFGGNGTTVAVASSSSGGNGTTVAVASSSSGTSSSSTGIAFMGNCGDPSDVKILQNQVIWPLIYKCAVANLGSLGGDAMCLQGSGFTQGCSQCLANYTLCGEHFCQGQCAGGQDDPTCRTCLDQQCNGLFMDCGGGVDPGADQCSSLISAWVQGFPAEGFATNAAYAAYQQLEQCACQTPKPGGCETVCDDAFSNGPPDFCNGAVISGACMNCLGSTCAGPLATCQQN